MADITESTKTKACPHCGGPAKLIAPMGYWVGKGKGYNGGAYAPPRARYVCAGLYEEPARFCGGRGDFETEAEARAAWNTRPAPPAMDREAVEIPAEMLGEVMQEAWGEICDDAGAHPSDMVHGRGTVLHFRPSHWTSLIALRLNERLSTLSADAIRQGEGLRALSDRATPGPWSWEQCGEKEDVPVVGIAFSGDDPDCKAPYEGEFRDSDASRMTIAFDWQSCDGHSPSANAAFAVAAVNFVRKLLATPASHASDGGKA